MNSTGAAHLDTTAHAGTFGLRLTTCARWEDLCDALAQDLATPVADPFAQHVVVVPHDAARRALSQALALRLGSDGLGICAGVEFISMTALRRRLEAQLLGVDADHDEWRSRGLVMAVLDVVDRVGDEPWFAPVARHLTQHGVRPGRRLATADRIARLLRHYARTAPQMVRAWNRGQYGDVLGAPLDASHLWQSRTWRLVAETLATPDPVSRHDALLAALTSADAGLVRLVDPVPALPLDVELVAALGEQARVWQLAPAIDAGLGALWGASRRSGLSQLGSRAGSTSQVGAVPAPTTVLQGLQARLTGAQVAMQGADPSVQVHSSHGPDRQVEVLREVLCDLFENDPTLEPRDVLVCSTNLAAHAPLVRATFCLDEDLVGRGLHPGHQLRVQVADAALSRPNLVLEVLRSVLGLATERARAQDLLDLCALRPVAARFALGSEDQERLHRLVEQADVRWGLDGRHRTQFGLGTVRQSTWLAGVERILVGIVMGSTPPTWLGTALPVDQVDGSDVLAAGTLAEVVSRLRKLVGTWQQSATITDWVVRLGEALDLMVAVDADDAWQLSRARAELADLAALATDRTALLELSDVQALFDRLLRTASGRPNHGNGSLLVGTLDDVADVARRVVVVLGLDDMHFPARPPVDGDDLTLRAASDPQADLRARSRQQLLGAVMAARDHLVVIHQGASARTNEPMPTPVAVQQLLDACEQQVLRVAHPLQPHSPRNFYASSDQPPLSFDQRALAGARARAVADPQPPTPLWQQRLVAPGVASPDVELTALQDFLRHPARELLKATLGMSMTEWDRPLPEQLPVGGNGLAEWAIGDRLLTQALEGTDLERAALAERLRGSLPPGELGSTAVGDMLPVVKRIASVVDRETSTPAQAFDCDLVLDGRHLTGQVVVHGAQLVGHSWSRTNANHLIAAWTSLLLLAATRPPGHLDWRALHVGKDAVAVLVAPPADVATRLLGEMVALRDEGLAQLVPLPAKTAAAYCTTLPLRPFRQQDPDKLAADEWRFEHDADWARFLGHDVDTLRAIAPLPTDPGVGDHSRFERLAQWFHTPLRDQMSVQNLR